MLKPRHGLVAAFSCLVLLTAAAAVAQTSEPDNTEAQISATVISDALSAPAAVDTVVAVIPTDAVPTDDELLDSDLIPIPDNAQVKKYVDLFATTRKKFLEDALARGSRYLPMIQEVFKAEGLPEDLIYLPIIESAFKTGALSRAGASGIWQFMRGTGTFNGLSSDWYVDERMDPEKSTRAAARLLKTLYGMFGDWDLALAAYNAGSGRVQKAMKRSRKDSFWEIAAGSRYLPRETREYVPLFLGALVVARDPLAYDVEIRVLENQLFDVVALTSPLDLRRVAEWIGTTVEMIQELNPELRRWTTPAKTEQYLLKVPAGTGVVVETRLAEGAPSDLARHVVKKGETLLAISRKLSVTRTDLAAANYLSTSARLKTGDTLIIPRAPESLKTMPAATTLATARPADESWSMLNAPGLSKVVHMVRPGDTIDSIARAYRTSAASLREWNGMLADSIQPGQELTIFAAGD